MKEQKGNISDPILLKYLKGEASVKEIALVEKWLNKGSENQSRFDQLAQTWKHSESVADFQSIAPDKDWEKVKARMNFTHVTSEKSFSKTRTLFTNWSKVAAILIILLGVSYVLYYYGFGSDSELIINTTLNQKADLVLGDGTKVYLNKNTSFSYPEKFSRKTREVHLNGEAYFEVAHNKNKAFIIHTPEGGKIKVLGTAFNVNTFEDSNTVVRVSEGKVALISPKEDVKQAVLVKGEVGVLSAKKVSKSKMSSNNYLSWKTGVLVFENASLEEVVYDLSKYYDTLIRIENKDLKYNKLTTLINNQTLDDVLEELKLVLNVNYSSADGSILIFKDD